VKNTDYFHLILSMLLVLMLVIAALVEWHLDHPQAAAYTL
jgi:hypothetical protein